MSQVQTLLIKMSPSYQTKQKTSPIVNQLPSLKCTKSWKLHFSRQKSKTNQTILWRATVKLGCPLRWFEIFLTNFNIKFVDFVRNFFHKSWLIISGGHLILSNNKCCKSGATFVECSNDFKNGSRLTFLLTGHLR